MVTLNNILSGRDRIAIQESKELVMGGQSVQMILPLSFQLPDGAWWQLPVEPLMSVSGKNVIVKRNVSKGQTRGTIKERWAHDDYSISIQGSLRHQDRHTYPSQDVATLQLAVTQRMAFRVKNELLQLLNINQIVVESYSFPFSKGENIQNYTIDAVSDNAYELFIDMKKNV